MILRYIDGPEVRFRVKDKIFVDMEFYHTGEKFEDMELRRMFPVSGKYKYIAVLDSEGNEQAMIRDVDNLDAQSRDAVKSCLEEYYMMPRILRFIEMSEKRGLFYDITGSSERYNNIGSLVFSFEVRSGSVNDAVSTAVSLLKE